MNRTITYSVKVGLFSSVFIIVYFLTIYFIGGIGVLDLTYKLDFWVPAIFIFMAIKFYKVKLNAGELRAWQGFSIGFFITATIIVVSSAFIYTFLKSSDYLEESKVIMYEYMDGEKLRYLKEMSEEEFVLTFPDFEQKYKFVEEVTPMSMVFDKMMVLSFFGFFYTLVSTAFLRKKYE